MPHPSLLEAFQKTPSFRALVGGLPGIGEAVVADGLIGSSAALMAAALRRAKPERLWVVVAPSPDSAEHFAADLDSLLGDGVALLYPQREALPYESDEPHVEIGGLRVEALEALLTGRASILVTTQRALQERSPAVERLDELQIELRVGSEVREAGSICKRAS